MQHLLQGMEHLCSHAETFAERGRTHGTNHELLEGDGRIAVRATVDDVHHGDGHHVRVHPADVAVEREVQAVGSRLCHGERNTQDGVRTQVRLRLRAVEGEHLSVDGTLLIDTAAHQCRGDDLVHVLHCLEHTLAAVAFGVLVTQFQSLMFARRSAGGHRCASDDARFQHYFHLDSRVST